MCSEKKKEKKEKKKKKKKKRNEHCADVSREKRAFFLCCSTIRKEF
jgi:hypothetical protein